MISDKPQTNVKGLVTGLRFIVVGGTLPVYLFGTEAQYTEGHARSIHGLTADGKHLILQSTGAYPNQGLTLRQAAEIAIQYGAVTAFDSGGGGDVTCILDGQSLIVPENINTATGAHFERPLPQTLLIYTRGVQTPIMPTYTIKAKADLTKVYSTAAGAGQIASINVADVVKADTLGAFIHITSKNGKALSGYVDATKVVATLDPVVVPPPPPPTPDPVTPPVPTTDKMTLTVTEAGVTKTYSIEGKITVS